MLSLIKLTAKCILAGCILLPIPKVENAEMRLLCDTVMLELCQVVLCDALIILNVL